MFLSKLFKKQPIPSPKSEDQITLYCVAHPSWSVATAKYNEDLKAGKVAPDALPPAPLTFVATRQQATEYCEHYFFLKHYSHFRLWCTCHNYDDPLDKNAWNEYSSIIFNSMPEDPDEILNVYSVVYTASQVAQLLRLTTLSLPIGAPWESPEEFNVLSDLDPSELSDEYATILDNFLILKDDADKAAQQSNQDRIITTPDPDFDIDDTHPNHNKHNNVNNNNDDDDNDGSPTLYS